MNKSILFILLFSLSIGYSQVGVNTTTPNAQLEIKSSNEATPSITDGILIPKVNAFPVSNPTAAQNGMMVFLTTPSGSNQPGFYYWDNASNSWVGITTTKSGWNVNGNSGMVTGTNFIGTTDANDLDIRTNNTIKTKITQKGQIEIFNTGESVFIGENAGENDDLTGNENTFLGYFSGNSNTTGYMNTGIGKQALFSNVNGYGNFAFGNYALNYNNGYYNGAIGTYSLFNNTIGNSNLGLGYRALYYNTTGNYNLAIGESALQSNIARSRSLAIGHYAMQNADNSTSVSDKFNTAVGYEALKGGPTPSLNTGWQNTAIGDSAMLSNTSGGANVAVGNNSLRNNTTGSINVAVGSESMYRNTTGYWNVALGGGALSSNTIGNENNAIGYAALGINSSGSYNVALGKMALYLNNTGNNNVGIGYYTLYSNTNNSGNTAVGSNSMQFANNNSLGILTYNTALGFEAFFGSTTVSNTGILNTAIGALSLKNNSTGSSNAALGYRSLFTNSTGNYNSSVGQESLFYNTTGSSNTATGYQSLFFNSTGNYNTANGYGALYSNTIGLHNTAIGSEALINNSSGDYNTSVGKQSLYSNSTGAYNTALGSVALASVTSGQFNTALGDASYYFNNYNNSIAIGYNSAINADNQVRIGNSVTTSIGGYTSWTNLSDSRFKKNIKENVPGLEFILKLRPVTYNLDINLLVKKLKEDSTIDDKGKIIPKSPSDFILKSRLEKSKNLQTGFLAQEVEKIANEIGYDFSGIDKPKTDDGLYGLKYSEFVVPLVKAIQEQQEIIILEKNKVTTLEQELQLLKEKQRLLEDRLLLLESK